MRDIFTHWDFLILGAIREKSTGKNSIVMNKRYNQQRQRINWNGCIPINGAKVRLGVSRWHKSYLTFEIREPDDCRTKRIFGKSSVHEYDLGVFVTRVLKSAQQHECLQFWGYGYETYPGLGYQNWNRPVYSRFRIDLISFWNEITGSTVKSNLRYKMLIK